MSYKMVKLLSGAIYKLFGVADGMLSQLFKHSSSLLIYTSLRNNSDKSMFVRAAMSVSRMHMSSRRPYRP